MTHRTLRIAMSGAVLAALVTAVPAAAQTTVTTTFVVSATVKRACRITATPIAITDLATPWDPTSGTRATASGTIGVRCTRGTPYTVNVGGGVYARKMTHTNGVDKLNYSLYASDCSTTFSAISATSSSNAVENHTVCAGIDPVQDPIQGDYSETVDATVQF